MRRVGSRVPESADATLFIKTAPQPCSARWNGSRRGHSPLWANVRFARTSNTVGWLPSIRVAYFPVARNADIAAEV